MIASSSPRSSDDDGGGRAILAALRGRLGEAGLHIVLPVDDTAFDDACRGLGVPPLAELLPGARGAVVIGDGGPSFFARFEAARGPGAAGSRDPLDDFTRATVSAAVGEAVAPWRVGFRLLYPFVGEEPGLPFQRLGRAAGLPPAGPLGLQIDPRFGPWWAYRALVVLPVAVERDAPVAGSCDGCPAPCIAACPVAAPARDGFDVGRCAGHRRTDAACHLSCAARIRCPIGSGERYPDRQLAFHMAASFPTPSPSPATPLPKA